MRFLIFLIFLVTMCQNAFSELTFSELVESFHNKTFELSELPSQFELILKSAANIIETSTMTINEQSSSHILDGLMKGKSLLDNRINGILKYDRYSSLLNECRYAADNVKYLTSTKFAKILEKVDAIVSVITDQANNALDEKFYNFKEQFESEIIPPIQKLLEKLRIDSIVVPQNVNFCVNPITTLLPTYERANTQLGEIHLQMGITLMNVAIHKQRTITEINNEAFPYLYEALEQVKKFQNSDSDLEKFSKLVVKCGAEAYDIIKEADKIFLQILKNSDLISAAVVRKREEKENSCDYDDMFYKDISYDYFSEQFHSLIVTTFNIFFKQLKNIKFFLPLNLEKCLAEIFH